MSLAHLSVIERFQGSKERVVAVPGVLRRASVIERLRRRAKLVLLQEDPP